MRNIIKLAAMSFALAIAAPAPAETIMQHATGTFTVKMTPAADSSAGGVALGRLAIAKAFTGGMAATAEGEMLTAAGAVPGSAAYVLIERVTGSIDGKAGSFAFMHHATMDRGKPDQHIAIVPDSGSGALAGITGAMTMRIDGGVHHYDLAYSLPAR